MDQERIDDVIAETLQLTEAVRDYLLAAQKGGAEAETVPERRLAAIRQTSHLTNLLTNVLSWLMWNKAVAAGEIGAADLAEHAREFADARPVTPPDATLPAALASLVVRGNALYRRAQDIPPPAGL